MDVTDITKSLKSLLTDIAFFILAIGAAWHLIVHVLPTWTFLPKRVIKWCRERGDQPSAEELVEKSLQHLGYRPQSIKNMKKYNNVGSFDQHAISDNACKIRLLSLIGRNIENSQSNMSYGHETPVKSKHYINTYAASFDLEERKEMCSLLLWLIAKNPPEKRIDFILVPKSGNTLLADQLARTAGYYCLFRKHEKEASRSRAEKASDPTACLVNIEGLKQLTQKDTERGEKFYGVVVDCNCSGGSSLRNAMKEFNEAIEVLGANIAPIDRAYVLYRPDSDPLTDGVPPGSPLKVIRFFDLNENTKQSIVEVSKANHGKGNLTGKHSYHSVLMMLQD